MAKATTQATKAAAKAALSPYQITAQQVRQEVAVYLELPEETEWQGMTSAQKRDYFLDAVQSVQQNKMSLGFETVAIWSDRLQFNAGYFINAIAIIEGNGFYTRTVNNAFGGAAPYDELQISARPFPA